MKSEYYKLFTIGQHEKEEAWLNEMSGKGLVLSEVQVPKYIFKQDTPGKYVYRLELLEHLPSHPESKNYIQFLEETGIEYIGAFKRWVYFRKPAKNGAFELYSDMDSKIKHYERITTLANVLSASIIVLIILLLGLAWRMNEASSFWSQYTDLENGLLYPYWFWSAALLVLVILIQWIVIPVRKSVRVLKKESMLRE
ncbi:hypothetical protein C2I18_00575 [Paenibacillus sp. PK3_47]|uniref:DUF2812 domain-containing protein n=1 Tax=Paenibacillus sp. PK3_47 TaxID=2072642 RepID=UPI00201DC684|nr:DUF2812 domain-containing protein [Paenibacillus sp. PK3_47]UQZ32176.1 hypothetical protein C2I18_00575 [Paenibacillus sp. PK3_47]